jgi:membrane fusion protein (multidrug efflux system)
MKKINITACVLAGVFVSSCGMSEAPKEGKLSVKDAYSVTTIEGFIVRPTPLTSGLTTSGTLLAEESTDLHPESSGRVVFVNLPEGKAVSRGTILLRLFDADIKTQISKLQSQLKQAEITEHRLEDLLKVKGVSQQEYDLASLQVQTLKSEILLQEINLERTVLRAPYDGKLGLRKISPGAYVTPSVAVSTIQSTGRMKLDFSVPEKYGMSVKVGQKISFNVEGSTITHQAVITATEPRISADNRSLLVRSTIVGSDDKLIPGSFATVKMQFDENPRALMIPNQALIPLARTKEVIVIKGGKASFIPVKTGTRQAALIEITEGLTVGDTIATTGVIFLKPGMPVSFSKVE